MHFKDLDDSQINVSFKDICEYLKSLSRCQCNFYSQVMVLVTSILVMPATNTGSKHSFSALQRIKSYLESLISNAHYSNMLNTI